MVKQCLFVMIRSCFQFYNELKDLRPEWFVKKSSAEGIEVKEEDKRELLPLEMVQLVATRAARDKKELYDLLGTKHIEKHWQKNLKLNLTLKLLF